MSLKLGVYYFKNKCRLYDDTVAEYLEKSKNVFFPVHNNNNVLLFSLLALTIITRFAEFHYI